MGLLYLYICVYIFIQIQIRGTKSITLFRLTGIKTNQRDQIFNKLETNMLFPSSEHMGAKLVDGRLY